MPRSLLPVALSLLLLAAHFLRIGNVAVVLVLVACAALMAVRKPWASVVLQTVLVLGVIVWLLALYGIATVRLANGEPWVRMAAILSSVTLLTGWSAWRFRRPSIRTWFGFDGAADAKRPAASDPQG